MNDQSIITPGEQSGDEGRRLDVEPGPEVAIELDAFYVQLRDLDGCTDKVNIITDRREDITLCRGERTRVIAKTLTVSFFSDDTESSSGAWMYFRGNYFYLN